MDDGLKFWRSVLAVDPAPAATGGGKDGRMRGRVDQFMATLTRNGYTPDQASKIATDCAKKEDRRK